MKKLFLGIDGGGTKTALCLIDEKMNVVSQAQSGPSSYDTVTQDVFKANVLDALSKMKIEGEIVSVFAGLGGIACEEDAMVVTKTLKTIKELENSIIEVDNDVVNAYYSSIGNEFGIVAIIGTGSVAYGINNGKTHRCGGYCYQEGDAGSSYDLGRKALQYYAKVIDKRMPKTDFSEAIGKEINVYCFADLAHYFVNATRTELASLAKVVTKYSDNIEAKEIIENAVDAIVLMVSTVYKELEFKECVFSIIGSLGNADTLYRKLLLEKLNLAVPNLKYIYPKYDAHLGSSIKALINYERI